MEKSLNSYKGNLLTIFFYKISRIEHAIEQNCGKLILICTRMGNFDSQFSFILPFSYWYFGILMVLKLGSADSVHNSDRIF